MQARGSEDLVLKDAPEVLGKVLCMRSSDGNDNEKPLNARREAAKKALPPPHTLS